MSSSGVAEDLKRGLEGLLVQVREDARGGITVEVLPDRLVEAAERLRNLGFDHVKSVTGIDLPSEKRVAVVYHLSSYTNPAYVKVIVALRTAVERSNPQLPSLSKVWLSSHYLERETFDLVGVVFQGHPDLGRILLPDDYEGPPPLRKDVVLKTEGIDA